MFAELLLDSFGLKEQIKVMNQPRERENINGVIYIYIAIP